MFRLRGWVISKWKIGLAVVEYLYFIVLGS